MIKPTLLCLILFASSETSIQTASAQSFSDPNLIAHAAPEALTCATNVSVTPTLRSEGASELVGDITITCTNGFIAEAGSQIPAINLTIFLNTAVTTRLKSLPGGVASDALLLIDEPNSGLSGASKTLLACGSPATGCTITALGTGVGNNSGVAGRPNIFQGVVSGNSVTFFGVPIAAPGPPPASRVFRITGIRVNATGLAGGSAAGAKSVIASISVSGAISLPIANPTPIVGFVQSGIRFSVRDPSDAIALSGSGSITPGSGPIPTGAPSAFLRFAEQFATVAKTRTDAAYSGTEISPPPAVQNVPGTFYNSESGLTFSVPSITVAPADSGTRFKAAFHDVPAGTSVWVGATNNALSPQNAARLITGEAVAFNPSPVSAVAGASAVAQVPLVNGNGTATWEALGVNPNAINNFDFPVWFIGNGTVNVTEIVDGSLAPNSAQGAFNSTDVSKASSTLPIPRFVDPAALGASQVFSQIVDGGGWKTTVILVNTDTAPASFTLRFRDESGASRTIPLGQDGVQSQLTGTIPVGGSRTIQTDGIAGTVLVGWAEVVSANSVSGFAVFRQRIEGRPDQEAAVPLVSSIGRFALPFDNTQGFVTAAALVNTNTTQPANTTAVFRGEDGASILQAPVNLSSRSHTAFALPDLFPAVGNRRGVTEFSFTSPDVTALGLRFNSNGGFTSFPVLSFQDPTLSAPTRSLSQVADGAGWKTSFVLANLDTDPAAITLRFWKDDGSPLRLQFEGVIGASETFTSTIPVGGALNLITRGTDSALSQGWVELTTTKRIGGLGVFRQSVLGRPDQEAAVPIVTSVNRFALAFDNTQGFVTSMALVNTNATQTVVVSVVMRDEAGFQFASDSLTVKPRSHVAFALSDRFPALGNRRGVVEFSTTNADLSGLGLRFNPGGAFTSFPILPK